MLFWFLLQNYYVRGHTYVSISLHPLWSFEVSILLFTNRSMTCLVVAVQLILNTIIREMVLVHAVNFLLLFHPSVRHCFG